MKITKKYLTQLGYEIVGAAIEVHKQLGPGLLESISEECLAYELQLRGFDTKRQVKVPVLYKGKKVKDDLSIDILVENCIIVETKSVKEFHPVWESQLLTYMKLAEKPKGFLINFNVTNITKEGLKPFVNELFEELEDE
jgi:GxxExxY protein